MIKNHLFLIKNGIMFFFYGKEVDDFHTLDKAQIFALHHSAIQELSRKNDDKSLQIKELKTENNNKTQEIT